MTEEKQFKLPPRKWYTLEQACKRIYKLTGEEVTTDDLIHYWLTNKLGIGIYASYRNGLYIDGKKIKHTHTISGNFTGQSFFNEYPSCEVLIFDQAEQIAGIKDNDNKQEKIDKINKQLNYFHSLITEFIDFSSPNVFPYEKLINATQNRKLLSAYKAYALNDATDIKNPSFFNGIFEGYFYISNSTCNFNNKVEFIVKNNKILLDEIHLTAFNEEDDIEKLKKTPTVNITFEKSEYISLNCFIIFDEALNGFLQGRDLDFNDPIAIIQRTPTNKQAQFIKDLLEIHYPKFSKGEKSIRQLTDVEPSQLIKDFTKAGKELPTGKTIENWLKNV
ncbi:hypothetical protein [Phocoenobacter skyensis]|uniref:Uncharacterized protein n=1 Tax=Phocoenobacter skyensis TaxID=97481 RepID=A0ABT9JI69_9PAST|nr:hypothetical protein [Pasteurella skyensis]MDP8078393.1 hypothetical protein [Pasteurella skyensis]MDP8084515.1 hypothetical protein [Pasteurella skyensis]